METKKSFFEYKFALMLYENQYTQFMVLFILKYTEICKVCLKYFNVKLSVQVISIFCLSIQSSISFQNFKYNCFRKDFIPMNIFIDIYKLEFNIATFKFHIKNRN